MAVSGNELQVTWDSGNNSKSISGSGSATSDAVNFSSNVASGVIELKAFHSGTPGSGDYVDLLDREEVIGAVVRTRKNVKPVYVSVGHKIDLASSIVAVVNCCRGYRLPEPTRLAHQAAGGHLKYKQPMVAVIK